MKRYMRKRADGQLSNWEIYAAEHPDRPKLGLWRSFAEWCGEWWWWWHQDRITKVFRLIRYSLTLKRWCMTPEEDRRNSEEVCRRMEEEIARLRAEPEEVKRERKKRMMARRTRIQRIADWCRDWKCILMLWMFPYR